jgi:hypothetical protein
MIPKVGKRVKFKLYMGREVDGVIRAILKETTGTKLVEEYGKGNFVAKIRPDQLIPPPDEKDVPGDVEF